MEDEHRYLRSKAAGKLIERKPNDPEPDPNVEKPNHATQVAGVVAMKPYKDADGEHKGIAYGLDKILDVKVGKEVDTLAGMEWALTQASDDAEVLNLSRHGEVKGDPVGSDYMMDFGDPDYHKKYGEQFDGFIDTHDVLLIQAAGNQINVTPAKKEYALTWGSDSYNAIVVGASTADGDNKPRAENAVLTSSGRGPTPAGRKKPDLIAPGNQITTTTRGGGFVKNAGGTSIAAPHVSGAILLLWDHGLWHPMMNKALLINSAEDRGPTGWDKEWGWGYIDLYTALEQFDYTKIGSIKGGAEQWYEGTMTGCQTVTLVWHIHPGQPLTNLDMYLYNAKQERLDFSTSVMDNVEQVKMPQGHDGTVYLRIVHWNSEGETETFGLAVPSEFESLTRQPFTPR